MTVGAPELVAPLPAHRFDEAALRRYLRPRLPGFDGEVGVRQFQGGQSNPTFLLSTAAGDYVLRKKPPGALLPRAHAVEREYRVMTALASSAVPVPTTRLLCEDDSIVGTAFFVMDFQPGRIFAEAAMHGEPAADRDAVYDELARVLADLHRVDWRAAGLADFGRPDNFMHRQVALWTRQWEAARVEENTAMDRLAQWLPRHLPADDATGATIAHGDFRLGNVIVAPDAPRIAAVLDWELSTIGHPLADLGYVLVYHFEQDAMSGDDTAAAQSEERRAAFVENYCRHAGRRVPDSLDVFVVFALFRMASIVAGVWRRGRDGNAADARAVTDLFRDRYRQLAHHGWRLAQQQL